MKAGTKWRLAPVRLDATPPALARLPSVFRVFRAQGPEFMNSAGNYWDFGLPPSYRKLSDDMPYNGPEAPFTD